jgi:hypothetical protein
MWMLDGLGILGPTVEYISLMWITSGSTIKHCIIGSEAYEPPFGGLYSGCVRAVLWFSSSDSGLYVLFSDF